MSKIRTALVIFLLSTSPLYAASIDEAGALKLKTSMQKTLDFHKKFNDAFAFDDNAKLIYEGDLKVTPQTDFYAVELPKISLKGKNPEGQEEIIEFGTITMNAIPGDKDNEWKVMTSLPQKMVFENGALEINIGGQTIAGIYHDSYGLIKTNLTLQDVTFKSEGKDSGAKIGTLKYISNFELDSTDNSFTGPSVVLLENFSFAEPEGTESFDIGELKINVDVAKLHVSTIDEMAAKIDKFASTLNEISKKSPDAVSNEDMQKFTEFFFELYDFKAQDLSVSYAAKNIKAKGAPPAAEGEDNIGNPESFSLANGSFNFNAKGMQSDTGTFGITFGYDGFNLEGVAAEDAKIPPTAVNVDLHADKVPYNALTALATSTIEAVKTNPEMAQMASMATLFKLPAILATSGANIKIANTFAKGTDYNATLDGNVVADMNALAGATGKVQGIFTGLDTLIDLVSKSINYQDLVEPLTALKESGTPTTKDGMAAYSYDIEATADGKFLINGKDMNAQPAVPAPEVEAAEPIPENAPQ